MTQVPSSSPIEFSGPDRSASVLLDHIMGSLFGAGLTLDRLAVRLSDPQDKNMLDTAVQHMDDVVRDVRLLLQVIDEPT